MAQEQRPSYAELFDMVLGQREQASALLRSCNATLRILAPLAEKEKEAQTGRPERPVFGRQSVAPSLPDVEE